MTCGIRQLAYSDDITLHSCDVMRLLIGVMSEHFVDLQDVELFASAE